MWKKTIVFFILSLAISCQNTVQEKQNSLFLGGNPDSIFIFDLKGKIYRTFPEGLHNGNLTKFSEKDIVYQNSGIIKKLDIETGETEEITNGYWPCYSPKHKAFLFYQNVDPWWLFIKQGDVEKKIILAAKNVNLLSSPVMISPDEAVFVGQNANLWIYNFETTKISDTGITNSVPIIFLSDKNQLICNSLSNDQEFIWTIKDNSVRPLKLPRHSGVIGMISGMDSLLISWSKWDFPIGERLAVARYSLLTGKTKEIYKHRYLTRVIPIEPSILPEPR